MRPAEHLERFERATAPRAVRSWASMLTLLLALGLGLGYLVVRQQPSSALAGPIAWQPRLQASLRDAQESKRPVLVRFTAEWCGPCRQMDREVYSQPRISERVNRNTVPTLIDLTRPDDATNALSVQYQVQFIPTALLLDEQGRVISRLEGGVDSTTFTRWLDMNGL